MEFTNWRREGLFLAIAGMETCWVVGLSRALLSRPALAVSGLSWWSVLALYLLAFTTARTVGRLELRRAQWIIAGLALFSSLLLLQANLGVPVQISSRQTDLPVAAPILALLLGFLVWFRAQRIPAHAGDIRAIARHFQIWLLVLIGSLLATSGPLAQQTDLVIGYFGFGLLAVALTRIEEVAHTEGGGSAPFNLKWVVTLAATLLAGGTIALLAAQVITIETVRWMLRPLTTFLHVLLFIAVMIISELVLQVLPLLRWLFGNISLQDLEDRLQELQEITAPVPQEERPEVRLLSPAIVDALWVGLVVALILVALWLVVRSFRRWRMSQYPTPGGVRETVTPEGTLTEDLMSYLRDQWQRLQAMDLRRLFQRLGTGSARAIYANLLALLAAAGHPRRPEQTPYEYAPVANEVLPTCQAEVAAITQAYVRAHYGEMEISAEELAHLQEAWKHLQTAGEELISQ